MCQYSAILLLHAHSPEFNANMEGHVAMAAERADAILHLPDDVKHRANSISACRLPCLLSVFSECTVIQTVEMKSTTRQRRCSFHYVPACCIQAAGTGRLILSSPGCALPKFTAPQHWI